VPEVKSWLLSFGDEATLIEPKWLVKEIETEIANMAKCYN
jgi:predicted DNA-binding transcriptional regulator YafY